MGPQTVSLAQEQSAQRSFVGSYDGSTKMRAGHTQNHDAQNCQLLGEGLLRISHIAAHENHCQLRIPCSQAITLCLPISSRLSLHLEDK